MQNAAFAFYVTLLDGATLRRDSLETLREYFVAEHAALLDATMGKPKPFGDMTDSILKDLHRLRTVPCFEAAALLLTSGLRGLAEFLAAEAQMEGRLD